MSIQKFRSIVTASRNYPTNLYGRPSFPIGLFISERRYSQKPSTQLISSESSKTLLRVWDAIASSNEVKVMQLMGIKMFKKSKIFLQKNIVETQKFQTYLIALQARILQMQIPMETLGHTTKKPAKQTEPAEKPKETCQNEKEAPAKPTDG